MSSPLAVETNVEDSDDDSWMWLGGKSNVNDKQDRAMLFASKDEASESLTEGAGVGPRLVTCSEDGDFLVVGGMSESDADTDELMAAAGSICCAVSGMQQNKGEAEVATIVAKPCAVLLGASDGEDDDWVFNISKGPLVPNTPPQSEAPEADQGIRPNDASLSTDDCPMTLTENTTAVLEHMVESLGSSVGACHLGSIERHPVADLIPVQSIPAGNCQPGVSTTHSLGNGLEHSTEFEIVEAVDPSACNKQSTDARRISGGTLMSEGLAPKTLLVPQLHLSDSCPQCGFTYSPGSAQANGSTSAASESTSPPLPAGPSHSLRAQTRCCRCFMYRSTSLEISSVPAALNPCETRMSEGGGQAPLVQQLIQLFERLSSDSGSSGCSMADVRFSQS